MKLILLIKKFIIISIFFILLLLFFNELSGYREPVECLLTVNEVTRNKISIVGLDNISLVLYSIEGNYTINNTVYNTKFISPYNYEINSIKRIEVSNDDNSNILWGEEMVIYSSLLFASIILLALNIK